MSVAILLQLCGWNLHFECLHTLFVIVACDEGQRQSFGPAVSSMSMKEQHHHLGIVEDKGCEVYVPGIQIVQTPSWRGYITVHGVRVHELLFVTRTLGSGSGTVRFTPHAYSSKGINLLSNAPFH